MACFSKRRIEIEPWWKKSQQPSTQILPSRISGAGSPRGASSICVDMVMSVLEKLAVQKIEVVYYRKALDAHRLLCLETIEACQ